MAQPRGPVEIMGVTTRKNTSPNRYCKADGLRIEVHSDYERVMRKDGSIEFYSPGCFEAEFGSRELYGD